MKQKIGYLWCLAGLYLFLGQSAIACLPEVNWGASISFCQGNSFSLSAANPGATYLWSTGASTSSINIGTSGVYWVEVTNACGKASDTIEVIVDQPVEVGLGEDRSICSSSSEILSVQASPNTIIEWSTGQTGKQITVRQSGTYWVKATNACGSFTDTVHFTAENMPSFSLGADISKCDFLGEVLHVPAHVSGSVLWSDGSTGDSLVVGSTGNYWVQVTNACGVFSDTIFVEYLLANPIFNQKDGVLCPGGNVTLNATGGGTAFLWNTGATGSSIQVSQPGVYWVRETGPCGFRYDTITINPVPQLNVDLGKDTAFCGNGISLDAGNGDNYIWSTGGTARQLSINTSGTYWVGVDAGCGYVYDTIQITVTPMPNPIIPDTIYTCAGNTPNPVDAGSWGTRTSYLWSDGSTKKVNSNLGLGAHWVQVSNRCDTTTASFFIKGVGANSVDLGSDTVLCGGKLTLDPGLSPLYNNFLWSTGSTAPDIEAKASGTYWVQVTNTCGTFTDTIKIAFMKRPGGIGSDTIYKCAGSTIKLRSKHYPGTAYEWNTGADTNEINVSAAGAYWFTGSNQCGSRQDTVYVIDSHPLQIDLGPDLRVCEGEEAWLSLNGIVADSLVWKGNQKGLSRKVTKSGAYWVTAYNACGAFSDTVNVIVEKAPKKVLNDASFCSGGSVVLDASQNASCSYVWGHGPTSASVSVDQEGWYFVDIFNDCDTIRDSAYVSEDALLPQFDLGKDTIFCSGSLVLDPGIANASYKWQNGKASQTFTVTKSGTYHVTVSNSCNSVSDTINVLVTGAPKLALGNVVKFCKGSSLNLNAGNPGSSYLWSTGGNGQELRVESSGIYWVNITNDCGFVTDTVRVEVEEPFNYIDLGRDTIICEGDSIRLDTHLPGALTKWNNGTFSQTIYVNKTGDYWAEVSNSCGRWMDTVHVEVQTEPVFSLGEDAKICSEGGSLALKAPAGMESYHWSDGSTADSLEINVQGIYWLTVSNQCYSYTDTIKVEEELPLELDLGPDTVLCHGESYFLSAQVAKYPVLWYDGSMGGGKEITRSGTYWASVENSCGLVYDTVQVRFDDYLNPEPEEVTVCRDDTAFFDLSDIKQKVVWFDGSEEKNRGFVNAGTYFATISNKCGEFQKEFTVNITHCDCPFFMANTFTPNGDGTNDLYEIGHSCDLTDFNMKVFNRWGAMVFETDNADESWDGTHKGQHLPEGVYTYVVDYAWDVYGYDRTRSKTGTIRLMR